MSYGTIDTSIATLKIEPLSAPTSIYVIGDSHALGFKSLLVRDSFTGGDYFTVARYINGLSATDFFAGSVLHPKVIACFEGDEIFRDGEAAHTLTSEKDLAIAFAGGKPQVAPLILTFCGDIDLRGNFFQYLKNDYDLILPFDKTYPATGKRIVPHDICMKFVKERLDNLFAGLHWLHGKGLVRTYLHVIAPPTMNAARSKEVHGFDCPVATRYKATVLYNHYLKQRCQQMGIPVIDHWPDVTEDGYLKPEFELDGVHLSKQANLISLRALIDHALNNTHSIKNANRYRLLQEMATRAVAVPAVETRERSPSLLGRIKSFFDKSPTKTAATDESVAAPPPPAWIKRESARFREQGVCQIEIDRSYVTKWVELLDFRSDIGNRHARLDWAGSPILPHNKNLRTAVPPLELLDDLREIFSSENFVEFYKECCGSLVTFLNCRPFLSMPHAATGDGPQSWHRDGCPPGVFRSIIYLTDVDADCGPFEYKDDQGQIHSFTGQAGTMLVFDADRLLHRGCPPKQTERRALDFVVAPRLPEEPLRVIWPGSNNHWPGDPFQYSVEGFLASPPFMAPEVTMRPRVAA